MKMIRVSDEVNDLYQKTYDPSKYREKIEYASALIKYAVEHMGKQENVDVADDVKETEPVENNNYIIPKNISILDPPPEPKNLKALSIRKNPILVPWRGFKWRVYEYEQIGKLESFSGFTIGGYDLPHKMIFITNEINLPFWSKSGSGTVELMMKEVEESLIEKYGDPDVELPEWFYKDFCDIDIVRLRKSQEAYNDELEAICGKRIKSI